MALDLIKIRRHLHAHPELPFQEAETCAYIESTLRSIGLKPCQRGKTGLSVDIGDGAAENIVALRADIDALPITEQTGLPYQSGTPGVMHACGHDAHTAIAIGVCEQLAARKGEFPNRRVRVVFQPAEESLAGAPTVLEAGALDGVSAIYCAHNRPELPVGCAGFNDKAIMAASARFSIEVRGLGGHGANPHRTHDPIVAASAIVMGAQQIVSRRVDALDPLVMSICHLSAGSVFNVIPETALLEGTARYLSDSVQKELPGLLDELVRGIAKGYGCEAGLSFHEQVPPLFCDQKLLRLARETTERVFGAGAARDFPQGMTADDFSLYGRYAPICYFWLGSGGPAGFHHPLFDIDESCISAGVRLLSELLLSTLSLS